MHVKFGEKRVVSGLVLVAGFLFVLFVLVGLFVFGSSVATGVVGLNQAGVG